MGGSRVRRAVVSEDVLTVRTWGRPLRLGRSVRLGLAGVLVATWLAVSSTPVRRDGRRHRGATPPTRPLTPLAARAAADQPQQLPDTRDRFRRPVDRVVEREAGETGVEIGSDPIDDLLWWTDRHE